MMTLKNAIKTLDDVIPPHTHRTVDREHMPIVLAWEAVKVELENRLPVVRCRECKEHRLFNGRDMCAKNATILDGHEVGLRATRADFYCADGERRTDE